jgi:hypothetical protein
MTESTAKGLCYRRGAAFTEEHAISSRSNARFTARTFHF